MDFDRGTRRVVVACCAVVLLVSSAFVTFVDLVFTKRATIEVVFLG